MRALCEVILIETEMEVRMHFPELPDWVIGFHKNDTIYIKERAIWKDREITDLFSLFVHEFVHVCSYRLGLPLWLYEGLAVMFAQQCEQEIPNWTARELMDAGYDHPAFYQISGAAVTELMHRIGPDHFFLRLFERDARYWNRLLEQTMEQSCVKTIII